MAENITWAWSLDEPNKQPEPIKLDDVWWDDSAPAFLKLPWINDQQDIISKEQEAKLKWPEPEVIPEPEIIPEPELEPEPTPEPTPKIEPEIEELPPKPEVKAEPTPKVELAPTPKVDKIESTQDIQSKEIANRAAEDAQVTVEQEKTINEFNQAITSWNLDTARGLAINNPELQGVFNSQVKLLLWDKANTDFFKKYSWMSNEKMISEVQNWNLVVWSEQYKLLPPEQRASFEQFTAENQAITNVDTEVTQSKFDLDNNKTISLESLVSDMKTLFSNDLRTKYNESLNSDAIRNEAKWLEGLQNDINSIDDELDRIEEDVKKEFPTLEESKQNSIIRDRRKNIIREKNTLVNQYNSKLWTYRSLKDDAQNELSFFKWEDAQQKDAYKTALWMYETRRQEMRADEAAQFLEKNKQLAEDVKFQRDIALKEFDSNLRKEEKGWIYKVDRQGREVYIKNWVSTFVRDTEWEILFTESNANYTDSTTKEDWVIVTTRSYKDWRTPEYFTYDINGNRSDNGNAIVDDMLSGISSDDLWCWEAVNKYVVWKLWVSRTDFWMWDSYDSKKRFINSNIPKVWWVAIWDTQAKQDWTQWENWHTWIVTWFNASTWEVQITDWNWNWDKKKLTHTVKISDVLGSDWGFYNPEKIPRAEAFDSVDKPLYKKFLEWKLTSSDQKAISDFETFKVKAELYQDSLNEEWSPQIEKLINLAIDLRDNAPGRKKRIVAWTETWQFFSEDLSDYQANFDAFISNKAMDNLISLKSNWATFWALSEKELQIIKDWATNLRANLSDEKFKSELNRVIKNLKKWLSPERFDEITGVKDLDIEEVPTTNWFDTYKNRAKSNWYDYKTYQTTKQ